MTSELTGDKHPPSTKSFKNITYQMLSLILYIVIKYKPSYK